MLTGPVEDNMANSVIAQLFLDAQDSTKDIYLYVNTPGGSVSAGLAIVDTMNFIKSDVQTIVMGMAASMGTIIASSGAKGKRFMLPNAEYMIHPTNGRNWWWYSANGYGYCCGTLAEDSKTLRANSCR